MLKILDVSNHNTFNNYNSIKTSGIAGVIMKVSEGSTFIDASFEKKYEGLKGKVKIGFYHFLSSTSEPEKQAKLFYSLIKDKQYQFIPVLDVEQTTLADLAEEYTQRFITEFKRLSKLDMIIYSGKCYIEAHFSNKFCNNNLFWVAAYSDKKPILPECKQIVAWQYTDKCKDYSFINGGVDCSILYDEKTFSLNKTSINPIKINPVLELQKELNNQCYTDKHWNELKEDGVMGELTLSACPTIKIGTTNKLVKWVQERLNTLLGVDLDVDGQFGEKTRQAVILFQKNVLIPTDGVIGKTTWSKLLNCR